MSFVLGTGACVAGLTAIGLSVCLGSQKAAEGHGREQTEQATLVVAALSVVSSEVRLVVINFSQDPVHGVKLLDVRRKEGDPGEGWKPVFRMPQLPTERDVLMPGSTFRLSLWLLDGTGQRLTQVTDGTALIYRIRFRDVKGRWWLLAEDPARPPSVPVPRYPR